MKIGIPSMGEKGLDEEVGEHFGRVPTYTIVDLTTQDVKVITNTSNHMGGEGYPPEILKREGVGAMVCKGLGRRAISLFEQMGIDVYIGAYGSVRDTVEAFKQGRVQLASMTDGCQQHTFGDHHHHE